MNRSDERVALFGQVGMNLVRKEEAEKDHKNYAQQLIDLHDTYLALVQGPFANNTLFQKVLKEVSSSACGSQLKQEAREK